MADLDFGFFNILYEDKKGLIYQKYFLDRLAPIFFPPRVARLVELRDLDSRICSIVLPLGPGNLMHLNDEKKQRLFEQSRELAGDFSLEMLAVDRRLKHELSHLDFGMPLLYGDYFVEVLAIVLTRRFLSRHAASKIIVVGTTRRFPMFLEAISQFYLPVSIQSFNPTHYEVLSYKLLYEKGCAVSTSYYNPDNWEKGDLVLGFQGMQYEPQARFTRASYFDLSNDSQGWAPELEWQMKNNGLGWRLYNLSPLLECTLLSKAGYYQTDEEANKVREEMLVDLPVMEELGSQMGIWEQFLDKAL